MYTPVTETTIAGIKFWTVYGECHYAQSKYTKEQALAEHDAKIATNSLRPPQYFPNEPHWRY